MLKFCSANSVFRLSILAAATAVTVGLAQSAAALPKGAADLLRFEQKFVNRSLDTNKIYALANHQNPEFAPETGLTFDVKSYWIPQSQAFVFESKSADLPNLKMHRTRRGEKQVLLLVHPESEKFYAALTENAERGPNFKATATASSRTLMMWSEKRPDEVFFGKLSLDKEIGGVVRTIPKGEISRSVGTTEILDEGQVDLPRGFKYLPEVFGLMPKGFERGGMLLRSLPSEYSSGKTKIIPLFALYTRPVGEEHSPLIEMINKSGLSANRFVTDKILAPFAKQWVKLVVDQGIAIEAHAQNVLMVIGGDSLPTGEFVYRDFGGFNIDLSFRRAKGLAIPKDLPVMQDEAEEYHQKFHEKSLTESLQTYFEGGFLFGMGEELAREGYTDLNYKGLTRLLHEEIQKQMAERGAEVKASPFESSLREQVKSLRSKADLQKIRCENAF